MQEQNNDDIIIDPPAPINVPYAQSVTDVEDKRAINIKRKPMPVVNRQNKKPIRTTSERKKNRYNDQVDSESFIRTEPVHQHLAKAMHENTKLNNTLSSPCESIIFEDGIKITDAAQVVNIDDPKVWDLINQTKVQYLGSGSNKIGEIEHSQDQSCLLIRGHDSDRVISEATTYINTAVDQQNVVNITMRDSMPRAIRPVYDNESNSYVLAMVKKRLGNKYRRNCLYVVKSSIFRVSDSQAAQRLFDYIESLDKDHGISQVALRQAGAIRKHVHELDCRYKNVDPNQTKFSSVNYPYTDTTLGIIHLIYCISLTDIAGYNDDEGSTFITNLDLCVNIGLHQNPPIHPVHQVYSNQLVINPGYLSKSVPQVFIGYAYYVKDLQNQKPVYAIVNGDVVCIEPQQYPVAIDASAELVGDEFIRVFNSGKDKLEGFDEHDKLLISDTSDVLLEQAIKSGFIYDSFEKAKHHLNTYVTSVNVDITKLSTELAAYEYKMAELKSSYEVSDKKHQTLLLSISAAEAELEAKRKNIQLEYDSKVVHEEKKVATLEVQARNDLQAHELKMQAAASSYHSDQSSGLLKVFAAGLGVTAAVVGLAKAFQK